MKPITFTLFLFAAFLLFSNPLQAQNQVIVTVNIHPPYSHRFADYTQYRTQVFLTLTNTTQQDLQMKVLGELTGQGTGFYLKTRPDYVPNQIITLSPGETRQFRGNEVTGYFDRNNTEDNIPGPVQTEILRTGLLPQDVYEYCIEVVDINTMAVLGRRCTTIPIQYLSPPQPNLPWCGDTHNIQTNPVINFSWTPTVGGALANANLRYDFYLLPVPEGQDPAQLLDLAMDGQINAFKVQDIATTGFLYNNLDELKAGQYVWGIKARDINGQVGIENDGKSQFCLLTISKGPNITQPNNINGNAGEIADCSCKSPAQPPAGPSANELLQPGVDVKVGAYTMRVRAVDANGNGDGRISLPGFPGGITLPIKVDFKGLAIDGQKNMMAGLVTAQVKAGVGFLPEVSNPQLATLPLGASEIGQLDEYFSQNAEQLMSNARNMVSEAGFQLPLGLDASELIVAITGLRFDATHAVLDAAVVINITDAGTKIALSGRNICLKDGMGLCGEAELYLAENLEIPAINMGLRGLKEAQKADDCTRVIFDSKGFKKLFIQAFYHFPEQTIVKAQGGGKAEARLSAETTTGWSDWIASVDMDAFRIVGVNDFMFSPGKASYDHSSKTNVANMPADYPEGQSPTWTGLFIEKVTVELPPIIQKQNNNQPLSGIAQNIIIDGNGLTGEVGLTNILKIGEGGNGNWQFSVDHFLVKFLKNTFVSGGFDGHLLLPITSRGEQSQLLYSSLLSYSNSQFAYQFTIAPKEDLEVDLFAALFSLSKNSSISVSYTAGKLEAAANLSGNLSIGGKFVNDLPRIQLAHVDFQNLKLKTNEPYIVPGEFTAALGSPPHAVAGLPVSVTGWELVSVGLKAKLNIRLSDYVGFLPNAESAFTVYGKFTGNGPAFDRFQVDKITLSGDFSVLKINGSLEFFHKDPKWGEGFSGVVDATFPPGFKVSSRMQLGDQNGTGYWYVDGQTAEESDFVSGLKAFGFSGGAYYNLATNKFQPQNDITVTQTPGNFSQPGGSPSGLQYVVSRGSSGMLASLVIGLGTKELFNANGKLEVEFKNGGVNFLHIIGKGRMFGAPGTDGLVSGGVDVQYDFPQQIFDLGVDMALKVPLFSGAGYLGLHSNGTTKEWNFKLGRPLGWTPGTPCVITLETPMFRVEAGAYFQCGNYQIDGLPTRLPGFMQDLFPEYPKGYERKANVYMTNGDAVALGAYFLATFHQNYLVFYAEISAAFGFDLQLAKVTQGCGNYHPPGMNGWYGAGNFYAGVKAAVGIEVDLFFISGKFEILSVSVGAILQGGGPNPTWVKGTVGGKYSILGGIIEGTCSFQFTAGEPCILEIDPLASLKVINETTPKPDKGPSGQVSKLQSVDIDPALTTNLRMGKEFFLEEQTKNSKNEPVTIPRLFKFDKDDIQVSLSADDNGHQPIRYDIDFDPEGFGEMLWMKEMLLANTNYVFTVKATVRECSVVNKQALSEDGQSARQLAFGNCQDESYWHPAVIKATGKPFADERIIRFSTDAGLERLNPKDVVYSLPQHGQRFFCYQDIARQAIMAFSKRQKVGSFLGDRENPSAPKTIKVRLIPNGASPDEIISYPIEEFGNDGIDPDYYGKYRADYGARPEGFWTAAMFQNLQPNTTYGIQFLMEWEVPPSNGPSQNMAAMATIVNKRLVANNMAEFNERQLNMQKYKLRRNQREIYRFYFRTSQYTGIENKLAGLDRNQLTFAQFQDDRSAPQLFRITAPDAGNWSAVIERLKAQYPPAVLNPPKDTWAGDYVGGIYLSKAGFSGPEKFDVFDAKGYEKTVLFANNISKTYKIRPLIELETGEMKNYWENFFDAALDTLLKNGINGNVTYQGPKWHNVPWNFRVNPEEQRGWVVNNPVLHVFQVMPPIDTTTSIPGNAAGVSLSQMNVNTGQFGMVTSYINNTKNIKAAGISTPNLIEISRGLTRLDAEPPGSIFPGNHWLNAALGGNIGNMHGPVNTQQLMSNIGAAYDFVNHQNGPGFQAAQGAAGLGAVQINLPGAGNRPVLRVGQH